MSNQEVEGEERPSIRCVRSFWASLNALHPDRDGYSARPQQQRLHAGSDNRRLPLSVCTSTRKIRVSDIHSSAISGGRRPSGMPWIFHRWTICFLRTSFCLTLSVIVWFRCPPILVYSLPYLRIVLFSCASGVSMIFFYKQTYDVVNLCRYYTRCYPTSLVE